MASITVCGIPAETSQEDLEKIMLAIVKKVQEISSFVGYYTEESIMVWFPSDLMKLGLGHEFSIDVPCLEGPFGPPIGIALEFCEVIAGFFPDYWRIECYVRPFMQNREDGYAVMTKPRERGVS